MTLCLLYVTTDSKENALELAHSLVSANLVACANILEGMTSVYRWQNEIEESHEVILLLKTVEANVEAVEKHVKTHHKYETPCILSLSIEKANEDFVKWVENSCKVAY